MGVAYSGHHGIGVKIKSIDFDDENLSDEIRGLEVMCEFLDEKLENERYSWFEVGGGSYTGNENEYYVVINLPFATLISNYENEKNALYDYLDQLGITPIGDFGSVGGLEVW